MKKLRCTICKKKLNIICKEIYTCKCNNLFCREVHLYNHDCTFDFHANEQKILETNLKAVKLKKY